MTPARTGPEPLAATPPDAIARPLLTQRWCEVSFLHWAADPDEVAAVLPAGTTPDTFDGVTYVGLVAFRIRDTGWFRLPAIPYLGSFPETNVRLYSVDGEGRRGVVFRSMDATRLIPVALARTTFRLPYRWARISLRRSGDTIRYRSRVRRPRPDGIYSRLAVRVGEPIDEPTELEHFLTARWGLHTTAGGALRYLPNAHPRWPLYRAEAVECEENLVSAAGLSAPGGSPVSVLYSPEVAVRFGRPVRVAG